MGTWLLKGPDFLILPAAAFFEFAERVSREEGEQKGAEYLEKMGYCMAVPYGNIPADDPQLALDFVKAILPRSGIGAIEKYEISADGKTLSVSMSDTVEARFNLAKRKKRNCLYMQGYLQFVGEHFLRMKAARCDEIECKAFGGKQCKFVVRKAEK